MAALARRVSEVVVVADRVVEAALPPNARGRSFRARTQFGRGLRLLDAVARELPGLRAGGAVVAHQIPLYAIAVAPLVRPAGVPLVLWWSHWKLDAVVRAAEAVSTRVATVGPTTFPKPSRKVVSIGQAIDVDRFALSPARHEGPLRALVVNRFSPAKGVGTILRGVRLAADRGVDVRIDVYGPATNDEARRERDALAALVDELALDGRAELHGAVTRAELVRLLADADVLVNNAPGGADRIVYEAAAAGVPVLASNPAHEDVLDPDAFFPRDDAGALAARLEALAALGEPERAALARRLRERVEHDHSVDSWAAGLLRAARH